MGPGLARMVAMEVKWVDSIGFGNRDRTCRQPGKKRGGPEDSCNATTL